LSLGAAPSGAQAPPARARLGEARHTSPVTSPGHVMPTAFAFIGT